MLKALLTNKAHRRAGDAARERRDWAAAEQGYRRYLSKVPDDAAIWVQLGHAAKEQDDLEHAASAYGRAVALRPADEEAWLHLAHVLLRAGRSADALDAFEKNHSVGGSRESFDCAIALGATMRPPLGAPRAVATFLLLDDLFKFLADHVTLSGIQRTQVGILAGLLADDPFGYRFLLMSDDSIHSDVIFWEISPVRIKSLIDYIVAGGDLERSALNILIADASSTSRRAVFVPDDLVFILGAFWIIGKTAATMISLKTMGAKIGVYVYDLIPISHPEFCHPGLVEQFARSFTEIIQFVDFFGTISRYVETVLAGFLRDNGLRTVPITTIPLSHFLTVPDIDQPPNEDFGRKLSLRLKGRPYALYVSTLEGRKNHLYVLNVWQELMRRGVDMPELIFLGRKGWRIEGLTAFLDATHDLDGHVHLMHDIGDGDLAYLYRNCEFTLFTSLVEGWGLPVGESLVFGRPCVASDCCSIPEVGGDLVDYVDPLNLRDGMSVIERMATDRSYRDGRARLIADTFRPRSWNDVADDFVRLMKQAHSVAATRTDHFSIPPGTGYSVLWQEIRTSDLSNLLEVPSRLVLGNGFYDQEVGQVWMRGTSAVIDIPTTLPTGATALIGISLIVAPWNPGGRFSLSPAAASEAAGRTASQLFAERTGMPLVATVEVPVGARGTASVRIEAVDPVPYVQPDGREFYIGVRSIAYQQADRPSAHAELLGCFVNEVSFTPEAVAPPRAPR